MLEIIRRTKEPWTPTHVLQALNEGWASLFVCEDGFAVLKKQKQDWTSELYVHVWALWFRPQKAKEKRGELIAWLDAVTRKEGLRYWEYGSPRRGWIALDECEPVRTVWRRKVNGN